MTPKKEHPWNSTSEMVSRPTNNAPLMKKNPKYPKMANTPQYEGSEAIYTNHSHCEKETEHKKDKESSSTIKYSDRLV